MTRKHPQRPGPKPNRLKIEGNPLEAFRKLLRPVPKADRKKGKKPRGK